MTYTSANYSLPKSLKLTKPANKVNLIVHGQSVVFFNATDDCALIFCDAKSKPGLRVDFTKTEVFACLEPSKKGLVDKNNKKGLSDNQGVYYWLSLDSQNQRLYAGVGEARVENAIYKYQFDRDDNWQNNKLFLESLTTVVVERLQITSLLRDPITSSVPLLVKDTDELTMNHIAAGIHMPKANLSHTSQKLYDCITGKNFVLNTKDFPNFTKAIEYSIKTPGMWCHERLKQKATEFNKDKPDYKETYLRITLNENNGESPGIPYVMEIWPVGHYSPIHNHGSSSAIIRVLNGSINVSLFPYLSGNVLEPFARIDFKKDHITWISPTLNQVHQLKNLDGNKDTCITIQCYMYEGENTAHYDYFDYLDADGKSQQYEPDSDMGFLEFKKTMKAEWKGRRRSWLGC